MLFDNAQYHPYCFQCHYSLMHITMIRS
jgi:hypothetical protein